MVSGEIPRPFCFTNPATCYTNVHDMNFTISQTAKSYPKHSYEHMKDAILGKKYSLSLIFVGEKRAQQLNKQYRDGDYIPNVLSFPLDKNNGEIYITPRIAKKESKKFDLTPNGYIGFLFIHGLLHLKGYPHGATMEKAEKKYCAQFKLK